MWFSRRLPPVFPGYSFFFTPDPDFVVLFVAVVEDAVFFDLFFGSGCSSVLTAGCSVCTFRITGFVIPVIGVPMAVPRVGVPTLETPMETSMGLPTSPRPGIFVIR
jgi:hypothetical protein